LFKKIENAYALDSIKGELQNSIYPRSYLRQLSNSKHSPSTSFKGFWILQNLNSTWFKNLPLFDEDKSLMLVLYLIESEAIPAKHSFKQNTELLIFG